MFKTPKALLLACGITNVVLADTPAENIPVPKPITPAVRPSAESMGGYASIDFLYWTARQESLEYAYDGQADTGVTQGGQVYFPEWRWDPGFKIGLGYYTAYDGWDVLAEYTRLKTSIAGHVFSSGATALKKNWQMSSAPTTLSQASSSWDLNYNVVDLSLGRNFFISQDLALHPYVGLKTLWQEQHYNVQYEGTNANSAIMTQNLHAAALGLRSGIDANFWCTKYLSIFGKMAASILWEKFTVDRLDLNFRLERVEAGSSEVRTNEYTTFDCSKHLSIAEPLVEAALGLEYQHYFFKDKLRLGLRASYEFQIFFDQSQFVRSILDSGGNGGNLTLQGLTFKTQFDF